MRETNLGASGSQMELPTIRQTNACKSPLHAHVDITQCRLTIVHLALSYPRRRQWLLYTASPSAGNTYVCTLGQLMHNKNKEGIKRSNQQVHVDAEAIFISTLGQHDNAENTKFTRCISCSFQWSFPLLSYTGWFVFFMSTNISITHILSYKIFFLFYLAWHKAVVICGQFT